MINVIKSKAKVKVYNYADGSMKVIVHNVMKDNKIIAKVKEVECSTGVKYFDACDKKGKYLVNNYLIRRFDSLNEAAECAEKEV